MDSSRKVVSIAPALEKRNALVEAHLPLVRSIARRLARVLPACFDLDDLIATGNMALIQAATRYRDSEGVTFGAYAQHRVRGAILDSVKGKRYEEATRPSIDNVIQFPSVAATAERDLDESRMEQRLAEAIQELPDRLRKVVVMSASDVGRSDIADHLGVCGRRVNQLRAEAIEMLREKLAS